MYPLLTKDPLTGEPLLVTRLEGPTTGIVIEGRFSLGWIGRLTPEQLEFVGALVRNRGNLQKVAVDMGASYNTARNRMDEIVAMLGGPQDAEPPAGPANQGEQGASSRRAILDRLAAGELSFEEAMRQIRSAP
jgi:hypothetical protein